MRCLPWGVDRVEGCLDTMRAGVLLLPASLLCAFLELSWPGLRGNVAGLAAASRRGATRRLVRRITAPLVLSALACSAGGDHPSVRFRITHADEVRERGMPVALPSQLAVPNTRQGRLSVQGLLFVPDPCDRLSASLVRHSDSLVLDVRARLSRRHEGGCDTSGKVTAIRYQADMDRLPPGSYSLRVLHAYEGLPASDSTSSRWLAHVAYEGTVLVGVVPP